MDKATRIYRNSQFDRVVREQDKSGDYLPKLQVISGNGKEKTNFLDITIDELGAIRKYLVIG